MQYKKKILPNGLRVMLVPMPESPTVTVAVLVGAGSDQEDKNAHGVAHFLEHMCFKGTESRPRALDISRELEGLGAINNAFTERRYTGYFAKAQARDGLKIFDIVSDLFLNPTFPDIELEKEKGVVIEEINMYEDMPQSLVDDLFQELLYGDTLYGRTILGTRDSIRGLNRDAILAFRNRHYNAQETVLVIAGAFDESDMLAHARKVFVAVPQGKSFKEKAPQFSAPSPVAHKVKQSEQTHIILGGRAIQSEHPDEPILKVMMTVLGGGMSSRLFQILREEMGVCYYAYAAASTNRLYGDFEIHAGIPAERTIEVIEVIAQELKRLREELVSDEELKTAINFKTGTLMLGLESSDELGFYYGLQEATGITVTSPQARAKELRSVTVQDIKRVARKLFKPENLRLALVGPLQEDRKLLQALAKAN